MNPVNSMNIANPVEPVNTLSQPPQAVGSVKSISQPVTGFNSGNVINQPISAPIKQSPVNQTVTAPIIQDPVIQQVPTNKPIPWDNIGNTSKQKLPELKSENSPDL
jgi:hypothetical protein